MQLQLSSKGRTKETATPAEEGETPGGGEGAGADEAVAEVVEGVEGADATAKGAGNCLFSSFGPLEKSTFSMISRACRCGRKY